MNVTLLSINPPGKLMGMGHYDRLLTTSLAALPDARDTTFDVVFSGRRSSRAVALHDGQIDTVEARFAGYSVYRLARLPWPLARLASRVVTRAKADVNHSLSLGFPVPSGRPSVYTIHDLPPARFADEGRLPRWAMRAAKAADAIVAPSQFAKRELIELLDLESEKVTVVPYGCEHDRFHPDVSPTDQAIRKRLGISGRFLLYVGGFTRRKNVAALLNAWAAVADKYPDTKLALAGPAAQLERLVADVSAPRVIVLGYIGRDQLPGLLRASGGLVFPSIYEGFGLPPLEAMASAVPVVAVRAGAIPEVTSGHAILAADGSPEALADAIGQLLANPDKAVELAHAGPQRAAEFNWTRHAEQVMSVYRSIIRSK